LLFALAWESLRPRTASLCARCLKDWTFWNHVRTIACIAASAFFIAAIAAR